MKVPSRGEIWLVNFNPTIGAEIKKTRPAVIASNDLNNQYAQTVTVLPITDKGKKVYPFEVSLSSQTKGLVKDSKIKCQQIRTIDKRRLVKFIGVVNEKSLQDIDKALSIHLGMLR